MGPGEHDLPRVVRGVHAVHRVPVANALHTSGSPGRGGGRSRERYLAARHRAVHLAHEHRLDKRLAVLSFALNGVVFVLLGTQLPLAFQGTWESTAVSNDKLIAYVLGLAFIVIFARFVWVMAMEWVHSRAERADRPFGLENVRTAAVMTLGGPKGAITLAVAFTISYAVPQRDLMIFMACGVIVVTLLLATFVVPLLAPKKPPTDEDLRCDETEVSIEILRTVIEDLAARQTAENRAATQMVIRSYNDRIARIKSRNDIEDEPNTALRLQAVRWEQELALKLIDDDLPLGDPFWAPLADGEPSTTFSASFPHKSACSRGKPGTWTGRAWGPKPYRTGPPPGGRSHAIQRYGPWIRSAQNDRRRHHRHEPATPWSPDAPAPTCRHLGPGCAAVRHHQRTSRQKSWCTSFLAFNDSTALHHRFPSLPAKPSGA